MLKRLARHLIACRQSYSIHRALKGKRRRPWETGRAKRFLCLQMNAIGDAIMTQPAWTAIKTSIPDATIDLACNKHVAPLFEKDPAIRQIHPLAKRRYQPWLFDHGRRMSQILAEGHYDLLVDFSALPLTAVRCAQHDSPPSVGFQRTIQTSAGVIDLGTAYDGTFPYSETTHLRVLMGNLVQTFLDPEAEIPSPRIHVAEEALGRASTLIARFGLQDKGFILVHPGAKWEPKSWPIHHWQQLIHLLREKMDLPLLILGGLEDRDRVDAIRRDKRLHPTACYLSHDICLSAALIQASRLCLCHDSAPMHMAAALGVKSISLFGPVCPARSAPPEHDGARTLYHELFCSPCTLYYSKDRCRRGINFCMHALNPADVARTVQAALVSEP